MGEVVPFAFDRQRVRVVMIAGDPWFVALDVADVLGCGHIREAVAQLDEDERMTVRISDGQKANPLKTHDPLPEADSRSPEGEIAPSGGTGRGGARFWTVVSESGLYALVFRSRLPAAKRFRRWVTGEVLPEIRKHGVHAMPARRGTGWTGAPEVLAQRLLPAGMRDRARRDRRRDEADRRSANRLALRVQAVAAVDAALGAGLRKGEAQAEAGAEFGVSRHTVRTWCDMAKGVAPEALGAVLVDGWGAGGRLARVPEVAVMAPLLRELSNPGISFAAAGRRALDEPRAAGCTNLPSLRTLRRNFEALAGGSVGLLGEETA